MNNGNVRNELKYLISKDLMRTLLEGINKYMTDSEFTRQTIHNVYYDNDSYSVIAKSKNAKIFKEKLRIRGYETSGVFNDKASIEIKQKFKGITYKRRYSAKTVELNEMLNRKEVMPNLPKNQIYLEMEHFIEKFNCYPKIYISYFRQAFVCTTGEDLRVTFDSNIKTRTTNLSLSSNEDDIYCTDEDFVIMEIKVNGALPLWFKDSITKLNILPRSYSKYAEIIMKKTISNELLEIEEE